MEMKTKFLTAVVMLLVALDCRTLAVPHRFVDIQDNLPIFQRNSVENNPFDVESESAKLKVYEREVEDEQQFSRSAIESVPITKLSYYQPLRSAVEFIPPHTSGFPSSKARFMIIVDPSADERNAKNFNLDAYDTSRPVVRPDRYRVDSPYQQLVDRKDFEKQQEGQESRPLNNVRPQQQQQQHQQKRPSFSQLRVSNDELKVVCYVTNWAFYRKGPGRFVPENLNAKLCTHIVFVYAKLDPELLELQEFDRWTDIENQLYERTIGLDSSVPVLLGIGGWTDSIGDKYSRLVKDPKARKNFIQKSIDFLRQHNFAGLHVDWNYPVCWQSDCRAGPASDKDNFATFIDEVSRAYRKQNLLVSASISGYKEIIQKSYDLKPLTQAVEFLSVMTYDYHGSWETRTGHVSPLYGSDEDTYPQYNTDYTMKLLVAMGAEKEKLILGIPFYGQSFTLSHKSSNQGFGSASLGPGKEGDYTLQSGMLAYNEICVNLRKPKWKKGADPSMKSGPYATNGAQWVGFDDVEMVSVKTKYAMEQGYGGVGAWTVDLDDFTNRCCFESSPLLKAINRAIGRLSTAPPQGEDCRAEPMPATPTPPTMATTVDSGAAGIPGASTTTTMIHFWSPSSTTTSKPTTKPPMTSRKPATTSTTKRSSTVPMPINVMPQCNQEGEFRGDPTNCGAYMVCTNRNYIKNYCPDGLHWNDKTKACDWPSNAKCSEVQYDSEPEAPTTKTTMKPSTTKKMRKKKTTTVSTTSTSTSTTTTTTTRRPTTTTTTTTEKEQPTTTNYVENDPPEPSTTIHPNTHVIGTTKKPSKRQPCVNGQYYPHKVCEKFYVCVNAKRTAFDCPPGTQYSTSLKSCDSKHLVKCVSKKQYLRLLEEHYAKTRVYNAALLKASDGEICEAETQAFYSSPNNCETYFVCDHNRLLARTCPEGLHFNSGQNVCDWPANVRCAREEVDNRIDHEGSEESGEDDEYEEEEDYEDSKEQTTKKNEVTSSSTRPKTSSATSTTTMRTTKTTTLEPRAPPSSTINFMPVPNDVQPLSTDYKLVCYFTNWAWYRPGAGKYLPEDIDANICTHIVYGFAVLNYDELTIKTHDSWADIDNKFYERVVEYKKKGIKVSLALGGWNDSAGDKYSRLVRNPSARARFIKHALEFLERFGFDGLDLDWEYPVCWQVDCKKGHADEKEHFAEFVKEISDAFRPKGLLLSSAVSPSKTVIDAGYDVPKLDKYFDWIAVMCYDYHGQWDKKTGHIAPLFFHPEDEIDFFNINYTINYWIQLGAQPSKLILGLPLYGQSFTLSDEKKNGLNANAPGPGTAGEFTRAAGFLSFYEICDRVTKRGWTVVQDPKGRIGPYAYKGNQWVSFDDQPMLTKKVDFMKSLRLGGAMVWALDLDDFKNTCGFGRHPLLKVIHAALQDASMTPSQMTPSGTNNDEEEEYYDEDDESGESLHESAEHSHETPLADPDVVVEPAKPVDDVPKDDDEEEEEEYEDEDVTNEVSTDQVEDFRVVCYFTNWAWYRPGIGKFVPENIDPELCTHIVYGFAVLNRDSLTMVPHDSWADIDNRFYERVVEFKQKGIKVSVAVGGWNDSAGDKYSRLVRDAAARARFIKKVMEFIEKYGFDGLDLDWEYPVCWQVECSKGQPDEKEHFAEFVRELSEAFKPKGLLLSSAVSPAKKVIDAGYDVKKISKYFDWIAVMAYDFHGQWDKKTGHVAPMYTHADDWEPTFNANFSINYWIEKGAPRKTLVMGMPMYGQSFSLAEAKNNGLNAPTYGGGEAGEETRARGFLSYYEICSNIRNKNWEVVRDNRGKMGPFARKGDQWVSFDDVSMIRHKSEFVKAMGLGGAMIWALDLDDFKNVCGCEEYPLLRTINRVLRKYPATSKKCILESEPKNDEPEPTKPTRMPTTMMTTAATRRTTEKPVKETKPATQQPPATKKTTKKPKPTTTMRTTSPSYDFGDDELSDEMSSCSVEGEYFDDKQNCAGYYLCNHGSLIHQTCPNGLHWNKNRCDWPSAANCQKLGDEEISNEVDDSNSSPPSSSTREPSYASKSTTSRTTRRTTTALSTTTQKPKEPQPESPFLLTGNEEYKMVCYFTNWAWYRPGAGKYKPADIDPNLCTHIVYGFAVLNRDTLTIRTHDSWADIDNNFYTQVSDLKQKGIKVTLAIGGWNDSLGDKYSRLVLDALARAKFIKHVIEFIQKYNFDGLDLDWEYPVCWQVDCTKGKPEEKNAFADFVQELSEAFKPHGLLLSAAVSPAKKVIDAGYDIKRVSQYFDWIAVMCYDYHGQWDKKTGHVAPLYEHPEDWETTFNSNFSIRYWISKGAPPKKLVMGMPMYGQSFTLEKIEANGLNERATGPGTAGQYTRAAGFLSFYEICEKVNQGGWTVVRDAEGRMGPYAYKDRQWVSYDDVNDIRRKTEFVKSMGLGGAMIWALDLDDFRNKCGCGYHPLLSTINLELGRISTSRRTDCT